MCREQSKRDVIRQIRAAIRRVLDALAEDPSDQTRGAVRGR